MCIIRDDWEVMKDAQSDLSGNSGISGAQCQLGFNLLGLYLLCIRL